MKEFLFLLLLLGFCKGDGNQSNLVHTLLQQIKVLETRLTAIESQNCPCDLTYLEDEVLTCITDIGQVAEDVQVDVKLNLFIELRI